MSRPATGSRAFFGGPPWWLVVAVPVGMILALFMLEAAGMPTAPAVLVLFAALFIVFTVAAVGRRGWPAALRTTVLPGAGGLLAGAAVMSSGLTITGVQRPWADDTYLPGLVALAVVLFGLQYLLGRSRRTTVSARAGDPGEGS